jgi:Uncharacterised nucleotidyltransferase
MHNNWPVPQNLFPTSYSRFFPYLKSIGFEQDNSRQLVTSYSSWKYKLLSLSNPMEELFLSFSNNSINYVVAKGISLGGTVYPSLFARPFNDLDIFIYPDETAKAMNILFSLGYNLSHHKVKSSIHHTFIQDGWPVIDLHFAATRDFNLKISFKNLFFNQTSKVAFGKTYFRVPHPLNHATFILLHALNHSFFISPLWSLDLLLLAKKFPLITYQLEDFMENAGLHGCYSLGVVLLDSIFPFNNHPFTLRKDPPLKIRLLEKLVTQSLRTGKETLQRSVIIRGLLQNSPSHTIQWICDRM